MYELNEVEVNARVNAKLSALASFRAEFIKTVTGWDVLDELEQERDRELFELQRQLRKKK